VSNELYRRSACILLPFGEHDTEIRLVDTGVHVVDWMFINDGNITAKSELFI
jgi:hypothetical protein